MKNPKNSLRTQYTTILGAVLALGQGMAARAQSAPEPEATERVEVTASRISRIGFTAPTPTTSIGAADLDARASATATSVLFELPSVRPNSVAQGTSQNTGLTPINLRNLGNNRTLILVDGRRFVPTTVTGVVDGNVIPNALISSVEVVTGGASAAWGSDAVSGVVNIRLKKNLDHLQGNVQYGLSQRGDNQVKSGSLAWGTPFAGDRGQFMIAGEFSMADKAQTTGDRDWSNKRTGFVSGTVNGATVTNIQTDGLSLSNLTLGGVVTGVGATSPLRGVQFGPGSTVQPFTYGANFGSGSFMGGPSTGGNDFWYIDKFAIQPPVDRKNLYSRVTYDFSARLRGFIEASVLQSGSDFKDAIPLYSPNAGRGAIAINTATNAYWRTLPGLAALRATPGIPASFTIGRYSEELGAANYVADNKSTRLVAGLDGDLGKDWQWKAHYTHGKTEFQGEIRNHLNVVNWAAALDAVTIGGQIVCNPVTVAALGAAPGCTPINPFGPGTITAANRAYVTGAQSNYTNYTQDAGGLQLQGEPFSTWAGKVSLGGGFEYRKEAVVGDSDSLSKVVWNNGPTRTLGSWQYGNPQPIDGSVKVNEWFAETVVPLLANQPFAKSLDLNAAARSTDYSTSGRVTSSKLGFTFKPVTGVLLRATGSQDIRAPNLNELFQSSAVTVAAITDFGRTGNPASVVAQRAVGNPNLKPEKADTQTFGVAWEPTNLAGFRASVDYYKINLKDAISSLSAQQGISACSGAQGFSATPSACNAITRDASGAIVSVDSTFQNFQGYVTSGIDYEVSYRFPLAKLAADAPGSLTLRLLANDLRSFVQKLGNSSIDRAGDIASAPFNAAGGAATGGNPKRRAAFSTTYLNGPLTLFAQARYIGAGKYDVTFTPANIVNNDVPSNTVVDASVQYTVVKSDKSKIQIYFKVNNLFDRAPPLLASTNQNFIATNQFLYDTVGRAFVAGVRFEY